MIKMINLLVIIFWVAVVNFGQGMETRQNNVKTQTNFTKTTNTSSIDYRNLALLKTLKANKNFWKNNTIFVTNLVFSPDSGILAATLVNADSEERFTKHSLWNVETDKMIMATPADEFGSENIAFSPNGKTIVTGGRIVKFYDVQTGKYLRKFIHKEMDLWSSSVYYSVDGDIIIESGVWNSGCCEGEPPATLRIWNGQTGKLLKEDNETFSSFPLNSISISLDGKMLAGGSMGQIWIFDTKNWSVLRKLDDNFFYYSVSFLSNGSILGFGEHEENEEYPKYVNQWDVKSGKLLYQHKINSDSLNSAMFSPDGSTIATCGNDETIKLFEVKTGQLIRLLKKESGTNNCQSIAFSPNGNMLATGNNNGTIKIWKVAEK